MLGFPGDPQPPKSFRVGIQNLLKKALEKPTEHPYVIFIDANMPPEYAKTKREEWVDHVNKAALLADPEAHTRGSAFNFLVVTNTPNHYGRVGGNVPDPVFYSLLTERSRRPVGEPAVFKAIQRSLSQSYAIPSEFPEE